MNQKLNDALNKLAKWRNVFVGWQLGTRGQKDPECQAVKDHREATIFLRAEVNALSGILIEKNIITLEEWESALLKEVELLDSDYEQLFPGFKTSALGVEMTQEAAETAKDWKP